MTLIFLLMSKNSVGVLKRENSSPPTSDLDTLSRFNFLNIKLLQNNLPVSDWTVAYWSVPQMDLFQDPVSKLSGSTPPPLCWESSQEAEVGVVSRHAQHWSSDVADCECNKWSPICMAQEDTRGSCTKAPMSLELQGVVGFQVCTCLHVSVVALAWSMASLSERRQRLLTRGPALPPARSSFSPPGMNKRHPGHHPGGGSPGH